MKNLKIVKWPDGDSPQVVLNNNIEEVRLVGCDTPELHDQYHNFDLTLNTGHEIEYYYARQATNLAISYFTPNSKFLFLLSGQDYYQRYMGFVYFNNQNFSEILISTGLARCAYFWLNNSNNSWFLKYMQTMEQAAAKQNGFWSFVISGILPSNIDFASQRRYSQLIKLHQNTPRKRMGLVFMKWERDRQYYNQNFLNQYHL